MKKVVKIFSSGLAIVVLSACSGAPDDSDIRALIEQQISERSALAGLFGAAVTVNSVKVLGCEKEAKGNLEYYSCETEIILSQLGREKTVSGTSQYAKNSQGKWYIIE